MPWNDNSNPGGKPGPKSGPKQGPWGGPPSGGSGGDGGGTGGGAPKGPGRQPPKRPGPPDFGDLGRQVSRQFGDIFGAGGGGIKPGAIAVAASGVFAIWVLSGVYVVQPNEEAVVTTFGRYTGWNGPGLRYHAPYPIQRVEKVPVTELKRTEIGGQAGAKVLEESLMLTGDQNIVDLAFTVQWRVSDASDYLFNLRDPDAAVKAVAESAMREVVGKKSLEPVLTTARGEVQAETRDLMQRTLNSYQAGIYIDEIQIKDATPPPPVVAAFNDVASARQDAASAVNKAEGIKAQAIQEAKGYAAQVRLEAEGEAARFNQVYAQYKLAPGVTRDRLYIETMQRVLQNANTVVIDSKGASAPIILPPDVFKPKVAGAAPAQAQEPRGGAR